MFRTVSLLLFFTTSLIPTRASANSPATIQDLNNVLGNFLNVTLALVGALSAIMLVVGGFMFLTAGGNKEATSKAGLTLTYAVIGLILAASAILIINLLGNFLGIDLGTFNVIVIP